MQSSSEAFSFRVTFYPVFFFFFPVMAYSISIFVYWFIPSYTHECVLDSVPTPRDRVVDRVLALRELNVMASCIL